MSAPRAPRPLLSSSRDLLWPAEATAQAAELLALLYQLEQSEWWSQRELERAQLAQLSRLLQHASARSGFYRERLESAGFGAGTLEPGALSGLPLLSRRELLTRSAELHCGDLGPEHGKLNQVQTSGSTGEIVVVRRSAASRRMLFALGLRAHAWHQSDLRQTLCAIRADSPVLDDDAEAARRGWGPPLTWLYRTGPAYTLPISTDVARQAAWLSRRRPGYLMTYPSNLSALLEQFEHERLTPPPLLSVRSLGETLTSEIRARCRELWRAPIVDVYSAQEVGVIAIECPESGLYHLQDESLIVEVLDEQGQRCQPGQVGQVVVTDLHNFAMPLVRYAIGDRAEVGPACPCGRGLGTLTRVLGRERNLVVLPNGERHWPLVGLHEYRALAPVLQYQLVQESLELVELRLVTEAPLTGAQEGALTAVVQRALGHPFQLRFRYFEGRLERGPGGKLEEFVCRV